MLITFPLSTLSMRDTTTWQEPHRQSALQDTSRYALQTQARQQGSEAPMKQ